MATLAESFMADLAGLSDDSELEDNDREDIEVCNILTCQSQESHFLQAPFARAICTSPPLFESSAVLEAVLLQSFD